MKAVERAKLVRSLRHESRRLRLVVLVISFFLVTLTFVVVSKPDALLFNLNGRLSVDQAPRSLLIRQRVDADDWRSADTLASTTGDPKVVDDDTAGEESNANATGANEEEERMLASEPEHSKRAVEATTSEILGGEDGEGRKSQQEGHKEHQQHKLPLPTVSNYTIHDATDGTDNANQEGSAEETQNLPQQEELSQEETVPEETGGVDAEELPECRDHRPSDFEKDGQCFYGYCENCLYPVTGDD